ncbi:MAG TPA: hypothetical protein DCW41_06455, partial [Clostridiales bacterium]|nr:hypothetical protein [Clostridiales bacterium]
MKGIAKKTTAVTLSVAVIGTSFLTAGCNLKDKKELKELTGEYMDLILKGKFDKTSDLYTDEDNDISNLILDPFNEQVFTAAMKNASYEVKDVEISGKDEAEVTVELLYADPQEVYDEDMEIDEFLEELEDSEELTDHEFTFTLVNDDEWLFDAESAGDLAEFITSLDDDLVFKGLNEVNALALVQNYYELIGEGKVAEAFDLVVFEGYEQEDISDTLTGLGITEDNSTFTEFMTAYAERTSNTFEVIDVEDDCITVEVTSVSPDTEELNDYINSEDVMVRVYAEVLYALFFSGSNEMTLGPALEPILQVMIDHIDEIEGTVENTRTLEVMEDEDGELYILMDEDSGNP